jgi:hypothetical protein
VPSFSRNLRETIEIQSPADVSTHHLRREESSGRNHLQAETQRYPFTWIKVNNPNYSQAIGRQELFERFTKAAAVL